jgi:hypothetical protein
MIKIFQNFDGLEKKTQPLAVRQTGTSYLTKTRWGTAHNSE